MKIPSKMMIVKIQKNRQKGKRKLKRGGKNLMMI